jgi:hypothetical protein
MSMTKPNEAELDAQEVDGDAFEAELAACEAAANDTAAGPLPNMLTLVRAALDPDLPF